MEIQQQNDDNLITSQIDENKNQKQNKIRESFHIFNAQIDKSKGVQIVNQYQLHGVIGKGGTSIVRLGIKQILGNEKKFAVKIIQKQQIRRTSLFGKGNLFKNDVLEPFKNEIEILKKLDNPYIVRLHEVINDPSSDKIYQIYEFAEGGQIIDWNNQNEKWFYCRDYKEKFQTEEDLRILFRKLLIGFHYIHGAKVYHRDIKPQNILADSKLNPKITDFGISINNGQQNTSKIHKKNTGTQCFMPPESFQDDNSKVSGSKYDIWSLGMTMWVFKFLSLPFNDGRVDSIMNDELIFPQDQQISDEMKDLFRRMLDKNSESRIGLNELIQHKWVNQESENLFNEINQIENETRQKEYDENDIKNKEMTRQYVMKKVGQHFKKLLGKNSEQEDQLEKKQIQQINKIGKKQNIDQQDQSSSESNDGSLWDGGDQSCSESIFGSQISIPSSSDDENDLKNNEYIKQLSTQITDEFLFQMEQLKKQRSKASQSSQDDKPLNTSKLSNIQKESSSSEDQVALDFSKALQVKITKLPSSSLLKQQYSKNKMDTINSIQELDDDRIINDMVINIIIFEYIQEKIDIYIN